MFIKPWTDTQRRDVRIFAIKLSLVALGVNLTEDYSPTGLQMPAHAGPNGVPA